MGCGVVPHCTPIFLKGNKMPKEFITDNQLIETLRDHENSFKEFINSEKVKFENYIESQLTIIKNHFPQITGIRTYGGLDFLPWTAEIIPYYDEDDSMVNMEILGNIDDYCRNESDWAKIKLPDDVKNAFKVLITLWDTAENKDYVETDEKDNGYLFCQSVILEAFEKFVTEAH